MVICLIALPVLALLGIFSATHRRLASEAFDCVFRRITLRKCESGLDVKLKSSITATVMKRSPSAAGWVFKHFELLSWIFVIVMLLSTFYSIQGLYNYVKYGNCNGEDSPLYCVLKDLDPRSNEPEVVECTEGNCPSNCTEKNGDQTAKIPG